MICNLSNSRKDAWQTQGFDGIRTKASQIIVGRDHQRNYEVASWEGGIPINGIPANGTLYRVHYLIKSDKTLTLWRKFHWVRFLVNFGFFFQENRQYLVFLIFKWNFARRHYIFKCEDNVLSLNMKRSPLLWFDIKIALLMQRLWQLRSLVELFFNPKRNFISPRGHVIFSLYLNWI